MWGQPQWAPSGHLAVGGFVGLRRVVFDVDVATAAVTPVAQGNSASYELVEYLGPDDALCRRRGLDGSVVLVRCQAGSDVVVETDRGPLPAWRGAQLVRWEAGGYELEGILVPPVGGVPPWPTVTFLHGGPVAALAAGGQERVGAWSDPRWATFIPDFPASGICGEAAMVAAFEARELPHDDREVDVILAGLDTLVAAGRSDPQRLFLVGHSYGAYLVNRAVTRTDRFRAAVCWEGVADLRLLDGTSLAMQATWRGGSPQQAPERWSAASPIDRADQIRTPMLLVYGAKSRLVAEGENWNQVLRRAGVEVELVVDADSGHTFDTRESADRFHEQVAEWFLRHR
jgi:dipeptidyl aminopeptidase/acylaminoacyl peptidase